MESTIPGKLPLGRSAVIFCAGACYHRHQRVERLDIAVDGRRHSTDASRMPRLDLFRALHPTLTPEQEASAERDPESPRDPELRSYRSGFWATIPIEPRDRQGTIEVRAEATLADGTTATATVGEIDVVRPDQPRSNEDLPDQAGEGTIAICMATFNPDIQLFRAQIDSIRAQTDTRWICLISDDCSEPDRFAAIEETVAGDPRFVVTRSAQRRGFYRNFERALELVPDQADLVALCDQDDRWYPDRLEVLRDAIGDAQLAYSDQRLVDPDGRVLRETLWKGRRNNHTNFASLLIANTIVGAASLFRRSVIETALPFPQGPGWDFHDHWLAIVALSIGEISYVDRPLYDYVQHGGAVLGKVGGDQARGGRWRRRPRLRGAFNRWRAAYFFGYLSAEVKAEALLGRCSSSLTARKRRMLKRFVASARSPFAFAWLATRPARELVGRNETLGAELLYAKGILWRHVLPISVRGHERPPGATYDARLPSPDDFEHERLRRWQAFP